MASSSIPQGLDRPIVGAIAIDPAMSGPCGLAAGRWDGMPISWQGDVMTTNASRWLGDAVGACCRPGERLILVAESTAFGGQAVARLLGMAVGAVELLLIDLNAVEPKTRVDVASRVWRKGMGIEAPRDLGPDSRRKALKLQAVERAREWVPGLRTGEHDRAEAMCIWAYGRQRYGV